jgi:hypothetical protein
MMVPSSLKVGRSWGTANTPKRILFIKKSPVFTDPNKSLSVSHKKEAKANTYRVLGVSFQVFPIGISSNELRLVDTERLDSWEVFASKFA